MTIYQFPLYTDHRFYLSGKKYHLRKRGVRALWLLEEICRRAPSDGNLTWLIPQRSRIREIEQIDPQAALTLVIQTALDDRIRCLAVWLRGRCRGTLGCAVVARFAATDNRTLRKEVARCLKRLSAWQELRLIAEIDPDARIRRLASQRPSRPHTDRLRAFVGNVAELPVAASDARLFIANHVELAKGRPPKPPWMIRSVLERIHRLVRGTPKV